MHNSNGDDNDGGSGDVNGDGNSEMKKHVKEQMDE